MVLGVLALAIGLLCGGVVAAAHVRLTRRVRSVMGFAGASPEVGATGGSALDWPEWRITSVISEPDAAPRALICVGPPADPQRSSVLLLEVQAPPTGLKVLTGWRDAKVVVMAVRRGNEAVELRRVESSERVRVMVISDSIAEPTPTP
jgi:hypothetical protein